MRRSVKLTFYALSMRALTSQEVRAEEQARSPMPEPILAESTTDIDGGEAGELELSDDGATLRSRHGGAQFQLTGIEAEWLATKRLGLRAELGASHSEIPGSFHRSDLDLGATAAWKIVSDTRRDFYLQAEVGAQLPMDHEPFSSPDQAALPFVLDLRAGTRVGIWTLRASAGAAAGGPSPYVPLRGSLAVLVGFDRTARTGFFGLEAVADGTWTTPIWLAPDIVADLGALGLPVRLGLALPLVPSARELKPSFGIYMRLMVEPFRDR